MRDKCSSCGAALPANKSITNCEYCSAQITGRVAAFPPKAPVYQPEAKPEIETNVRKYFSGCVGTFVLTGVLSAFAVKNKDMDIWVGVMGLMFFIAFTLTIVSFIKWMIKRATS